MDKNDGAEAGSKIKIVLVDRRMVYYHEWFKFYQGFETLRRRTKNVVNYNRKID